jgi:D-sedoheptulose 7-phosphate isomerase
MLEQRIQQHFIDSADLKYQTGPVLSKPISQAMQAILACVTSGGKVLACGAGVSGLLASAVRRAVRRPLRTRAP